MSFVIFMSGSTQSHLAVVLVLKRLRRWRPQFKVSSHRLGEPGIKLKTPGYKASHLSTLPRLDSVRPSVRPSHFFVIASPLEPLDVATSNYAGV